MVGMLSRQSPRNFVLDMNPRNVQRRKARAIALDLKKRGIKRPRGRPAGPSSTTLQKRRRAYIEGKTARLLSKQGINESQLEAALKTNAGSKLFPLLVPDPKKETILQSAIDLVHNVGRGVKPDLVRCLGKHLKAREVSTLFSMPLKTVQNIFARQRSSSNPSPLELAYPHNVPREKIKPFEADMQKVY